MRKRFKETCPESPCACPACKWLDATVDSWEIDSSMELLKEVCLSESRSMEFIGILQGLTCAAASMKIPLPQNLDDFVKMLANLRLQTKELGKFPFGK